MLYCWAFLLLTFICIIIHMSSQAHNIIHAVHISSPLYLCCVCAVHRTDMMDWRECGATHNSIAIIRFDAFSLDADALIHDDGIACRDEKRLWIVHMWPRPFSLSSIHNRSLKMFAQYFFACARVCLCVCAVFFLSCFNSLRPLRLRFFEMEMIWLCFAFVALHWFMFGFNCFAKPYIVYLIIGFYLCRAFESAK